MAIDSRYEDPVWAIDEVAEQFNDELKDQCCDILTSIMGANKARSLMRNPSIPMIIKKIAAKLLWTCPDEGRFETAYIQGGKVFSNAMKLWYISAKKSQDIFSMFTPCGSVANSDEKPVKREHVPPHQLVFDLPDDLVSILGKRPADQSMGGIFQHSQDLEVSEDSADDGEELKQSE